MGGGSEPCTGRGGQEKTAEGLGYTESAEGDESSGPH